MVTFRQFTNPHAEFTYYAYCPKSGEPILMKVVTTLKEIKIPVETGLEVA